MLFPRGLVVAGSLGILALTGWVTRPIAVPAWQAVRAAEPALQLRSLEGSIGQGITLGLLGGFRAVLADFLWVETNLHWEKRDLPATHKRIEMVTTIDPRPLYFWLNGARMIAYDMPVWRIDAAGGMGKVADDVRARIDAEQAHAALRLLDSALLVHPEHPLLLIEIANLHFRRLRDLETAARFYRLAAEQPDAPRYAARLHAEVLKQLGRPREAYEWLRSIYPSLPPEDPMTPFVLGRIRELEDQLRLAEADRFQVGH